MYALVVARKICLAHKLLSTAMHWTDIVFLAGHIVSQHMLVVVVSSGEALVHTQVAAVCGVGRISMSSVSGAFPR
jgi:hypothetical protein